MGFPGSSPACCTFLGGHPEDGKAQVTREPTGHPEADGARGPSRPPRPRPPRASTGPFPRAATGPIPRVSTGPFPRAATGPIPRIPAAPDPAFPDPVGSDPWSGTAPGFEFEGRRSRPGRGPRRTQPGRDQDRGRPGQPDSRDTWPPGAPCEPMGREEAGRAAAGSVPRHFRYTPTVGQPLSAPPQAWLDDGQRGMPGFEFDDQPQNAAPLGVPPRGAVPREAFTREPRQAGPRQAARVRRRGRGRIRGRPAPSGPGCCARCCPSRSSAGGPASSWMGSSSGAGGSGSRSRSSPWSSSVSPSS